MGGASRRRDVLLNIFSVDRNSADAGGWAVVPDVLVW